MKSIVYYDVSHRQFAFFPDGTRVPLNLLLQKVLESDTTPESVVKEIQEIDLSKVDLQGINKPTQWERVVSVLIYCLSGYFPLRQEVLRGRQILSALPKSLKKMGIADEIAFSLLPYILIAAKTHTDDLFHSDSNKIKDVTAFINKLSLLEGPIVNTYLCAHRGRSVTVRHVLIDSIHLERAHVALNVQKGIIANRPWPKGKGIVNWYQQGPTEWASQNMFPEMFIRYMAGGEVRILLSLLRKHFTELETLFKKDSDATSLTARLQMLDPVTEGTISFLEEQYGAGWRKLDYTGSAHASDPLVSIAVKNALPVIQRQMPFFEKHRRGEIDLGSMKRDLLQANLRLNDRSSHHMVDDGVVKDAIERFFQTQLMQPSAKALYETAFYYLWGVRCAQEENDVAIGLDRDHAEFQYDAWKLGYSTSSQESTSGNPLLYCRRTKEDLEGTALKDYSIRQFWR